jgi:integrase
LSAARVCSGRARRPSGGQGDVRWYDLRHSCAALLIAAGRHPLEIKTRLRHASITTTMDRYGRLFPSAEAALADALDTNYNAALDNVVPLARDDDDPPAAALAAV